MEENDSSEHVLEDEIIYRCFKEKKTEKFIISGRVHKEYVNLTGSLEDFYNLVRKMEKKRTNSTFGNTSR